MKNRQFAKISLLVVAGLMVLFAGSLAAQSVVVTPSSTLNFAATVNSNSPQTQSFQVSSTDGKSYSWFYGGLQCTAGATSCPIDGNPWVTVSPPEGSFTPQTVTVTVNPFNLTDGNYQATYQVQLGIGGAAQTITINLCVGSTCTTSFLTANPTSLTFNGQVGQSAAPQALTIGATGSALSWMAVSANTPWLTISPTAGTTGSTTPVVTATIGTLAVGNYSGTITFTDTASNNTLVVPVTLNVTQNSSSSSALLVNSNTYNFDGVAGNAIPAQQVWVLDNGSGPLSWTATTSVSVPSGGTWLSLSATSGTTPASVMITANATSLSAGTYVGAINFTAGGNNVQTVTVIMNLAANTNVTLTTNTGQLSFGTVQGGSVSNQSIVLSGTSLGANSLQFSAFPYTASGDAWLTVTPATGTITSTSAATVSVGVNATGLSAGTYTGTISFEGVGVPQPTPVTITLTVTSTSNLTVNANTFTFTGAIGSTISTQTLTIGATGTLSTTWSSTITTSSGGSWLSLTPTSAAVSTSQNSQATIAVNTNGLSVGTYTGTITITAPGASNSQVVTVVLTLNPLPTLTLSSNTLSFTGQAGGTIGSQSVQVSASDGSSRSWSAATAITTPPGGSWLSVSPSSGGTTPVSVNVSINTAGLSAGAYTGQVAFTLTGSSTATTLAVTLTLSPGVSLSVTPATLTFAGAPGGNIAAQPVSVTATGTTSSLNWTASATTASGGSWLSVTTSGSTPGTASVAVSLAGLALGTYNGTVRISASGAANTITIPVTLNMTNPQVAVSSNTIAFTGSSGNTQTFTVTSTGATAINWTSQLATQSGGNWLGISPSSGSTPTTVTLTANTIGLAPGTYSGTILIAASDLTSTQLVNVSITITPVLVMSVGPTSLQFITPVIPMGELAALQIGTFDVQNLGTGSLTYAVNATTATGGNWLTATFSSNTAPSTVTVNANPQGLSAGSYFGTVTVTATNTQTVTNSPQTVFVTLNVGSPTIYAGGIVNAASANNDGAASPGELLSLFGLNLCASTASPSGLPLPTTLNNTQVLVNGTAVPLFFVSSGQINFQFPFITGNSATIAVVNGTQESLTQLIEIAPVTPAIFGGGAQGLGQILNQDFSQNSPTHPASAGQTIQMFVGGLGVTNPALTTGAAGAGTAPLNSTVAVPAVTIGGISATVTSSLAAPGLVGVYQVNVTVPSGLSAGGFATVQMLVGGKASNTVILATK